MVVVVVIVVVIAIAAMATIIGSETPAAADSSRPIGSLRAMGRVGSIYFGPINKGGRTFPASWGHEPFGLGVAVMGGIDAAIL
jgi:hypothetical protein